MDVMPKWADVILIPLISILLAAILSALVILAIGENPWDALKLMVDGALGSTYGWGYTLYYATNFIFTGLAVSIAFHARMFNIGGEGQALIGGLGVAPSGNLGDNCAVFEAVHGSAPDIAGKGIANPTALLLSGALMLQQMGEPDAAERIREAVKTVIREGKKTTGDLGGSCSTEEYTDALIQRL